MRILLIAALVSSVALAGCGGGEKNSSANNSASASGGAGGGVASARLEPVISQCEQGIKSVPNAPPGFNAAATCRCAVETALGDQPDPAKFARSPEGQQVLGQAIISCAQQHMGGAAGAAGAKGDAK